MSARDAVLISIAAHVVIGGVIAWASTVDLDLPAGPARETADDRDTPKAEVSVEVDNVIEVAMLPPDEVPAPVAPPAVAAAAAIAPRASTAPRAPTPWSAVAGAAAISSFEATTSAGATAETTGPASTEAGDGKPSKYMGMRHGPDLELPDDVAARVIANGKPPPAAPDDSRLVHRGGNIYIPDLQVPAKVNEDGTVTFHDKPAADIHWRIHLPSAKDLGDALADWYADPYAQTRARPWQELNKVDQAVEGGGAGWDSGGSVEDGASVASMRKQGYSQSGQPQVPIVGGTLDLTSWAMRKFHVGDPYASRKRKLLADTFDARAQIRATNADARLARSLALMQLNVSRVWTAPLTAEAKRAALFALWDECAEGDPATSTEARAGETARLIVIAFIHTHAAAGTSEAYTADEIATLDAGRTSKQHFAPYAE